MSKDQSHCEGCRDNFYNSGNNELGVKECWGLKTAKLVRRYKIAWWTAPTEPRAFREVRTYQCHHAPGRFGFYKELPDFAKSPRLLERSAGEEV